MNTVTVDREEVTTLLDTLRYSSDKAERDQAHAMLRDLIEPPVEVADDIAERIAAKEADLERHIVSREHERWMRYRAMWSERCHGIWINRATNIEMRHGPHGRTVTATFDVSPDDKSVVPEVDTVSIGFTSPFMTVDDAGVCLAELLNLLARGWQETGKAAQ